MGTEAPPETSARSLASTASGVRKSEFRHHLIAGSFAGVAEHVSVFPLDTLKTHLQALGKNRGANGLLGDLAVGRSLILKNGVQGLYRGVSVTGLMCGPAHALMFAAYEHILQVGATKDGQASAERTAIVGAAAGAISTFLHDAVMVPADVIKQRLQLGFYRNWFDDWRQ